MADPQRSLLKTLSPYPWMNQHVNSVPGFAVSNLPVLKFRAWNPEAHLRSSNLDPTLQRGLETSASSFPSHSSSSNLLSSVDGPSNRLQNASDYSLPISPYDHSHQARTERMEVNFPKQSNDARDPQERGWSKLRPVEQAILEQITPMAATTTRAELATLSDNDIHATSGNLAPSSFSAFNGLPMQADTGSTHRIDEQRPKPFGLHSRLKDSSLETVESTVGVAIELLDTVTPLLTEQIGHDPDAEEWTHRIEKLRSQIPTPRTIIGVVGSTGAGKSSILNAILDVERVVPTNGMRACTSVVTEISYNYETEPYRASIEFVSASDWTSELKILFQNLVGEDGEISEEYVDQETDAGIAFAKITAVYPYMTKENVANSNVQSMLRDGSVSQVLGSNHCITEKTASLLYKAVHRYIDSKEKSSGSGETSKQQHKEMEYWPLIRVVKIFLKSPVLSTGAVLVDLPGVQDANLARVAVAENYMKHCRAFWIVTPIVRAVDDQAAKILLGEAFRLQLKMDGGLGDVTFICSKTDDIDAAEAEESLGLHKELSPLRAEKARLLEEQESLKLRLDEANASKVDYDKVADEADEQLELWEKLKEDNRNDAMIQAPKYKATQGKRRSNTNNVLAKKRRRKKDASEGITHDSDSSTSSSEEDKDTSDRDFADNETGTQGLMQREQVLQKIQELRSMKREARTQKQHVMEELDRLRLRLSQSSQSEKEAESEIYALCISRRNQHCKGVVQTDYAASIRELDHEQAIRADEEAFDPEVEQRDYNAVAQGLPVFCVSSRGYQKLKRRIRKDGTSPKFRAIEETEIPQLQNHCVGLTRAGRLADCYVFVNKLSQLMNSFALWASSGRFGAQNTSKNVKQPRYLQESLEELAIALKSAVRLACIEVHGEIETKVLRKSKTAVIKAVDEALDTVNKWGTPAIKRNPSAGGTYFSTYKAICRFHGVYTNKHGNYRWNKELVEPMIRTLSSGWEECFSNRIHKVMRAFIRRTTTSMTAFHTDIASQASEIDPLVDLSTLKQQVDVNGSILQDAAVAAERTLKSDQRDINRAFAPAIQLAMVAAYNRCFAERGAGSYARMRSAMMSHVALERHNMFKNSMDEVEDQLSALVEKVGKQLEKKINEVLMQVDQDYNSVLSERSHSEDSKILPEAQRLARQEILSIINDFQSKNPMMVGTDAGGEITVNTGGEGN